MKEFRQLIIALVAALVLAASPSTVFAQDIATQERAAAAVADGRFDEALDLLNTQIAPDSRDTRALLLRARAYEGSGSKVSATADYQRVLEIDPGNQEALDGLRRTQLGRNSNNSNIGSLERLVQANPDNLAYRIRFADALFDARDYQLAADQYGFYTERTQATPDIIQRYLIAIANYRGDNALGEAVAEDYTEIYRTDDDLWMRLGYFRLWQGNYSGALEACETSLRLNPSNREARDCEVQSRNPDAIARTSTYPIDVLMRELRAEPDDDAKRFRLVDLMMEAGRYFEARQQLDLLAVRHRGEDDWQRRYNTVNDRLRNAPGPVTQTSRLSTFPIDVLTRELLANPRQDEKRFRLVNLLIEDGRYFEAEQNLGYLRSRHESSDRWQERYTLIRRELSALTDGGRSKLSTYPIDVLTRRLMADPSQDETRFELVGLLLENDRFFEADQNLAFLRSGYGTTSRWTALNRRAEIGLRSVERTATRQSRPVRVEFIVDRLLRELRANPNDDDKRFSLIKQLIKYDRFAEAYDQLQLLEPRHGEGDRWLAYFVQTDDGLVRTTGTSPIYAIDRFTYRLRYEPSNLQARYALVDALIDAGRAAEALAVLTDSRYSNPSDAGYQDRLYTVSEMRMAQARDEVMGLESRLAANPNDLEALRDITDSYLVLGRTEDAFAAYAAVLSAEPGNDALRARYADALRSQGYWEEAARQAAFLLDNQPENPDYQRIYVLSSLSGGGLDDLGEAYAQHLLDLDGPDDSELLIDLAQFRLATGDIEGADALVRRADAIADPSFVTRIETVAQLVAREKIRAGEAERLDLLNDARRLAAARNFPAAIDAYESYFDRQGSRSRAELKELAQVHSAAGDFVSSLSILTALQDQAYEYDVAKEIARNQIFREDYSGALRTLESLHSENPQDYEVRFLQADAYRELGLYTQAEQIYEDAKRLAEASETIDERSVSLDLSLRRSLAESGEWRGLDFAGIIVPTADATVAHGGGTRYDRWAQGMQTQVSLPVGDGTVLAAGVNSHFISGTRRLVPGASIARGRVNQVFVGGYLDLTPPDYSVTNDTYTNRLSGDVGIYDYEGGRTVGYGGIRYWRRVPGAYKGSIGLRLGEGSIMLWSPAGGEFGLRVTQLDMKGATASVLPDSSLRLAGQLTFNIVRDNFGNLGSTTGTNTGTNIRVEAAYRVVPYTYFGLTYYQIDYRNTTDLYFSPRNYASYDVFLEYEKDVVGNWYTRIRGAMGIIARSSGFVSRRLEADFIRRLGDNFSLTITTSMGQSTRSLGSGSSSFIDRYNTFTFGAALYWTL